MFCQSNGVCVNFLNAKVCKQFLIRYNVPVLEIVLQFFGMFTHLQCLRPRIIHLFSTAYAKFC